MFLVHDQLFSLATFKHLSFRAFSIYYHVYMSGYGSLCVPPTLVHWVGGCSLMFSIKFGKFFSPHCSDFFFLSLSSLDGHSYYTYVGASNGSPHLSEVLNIFFSFFFLSLLIRLHNHYWAIFKFTDFLVCWLKSNVELS